MAKSLFFSFLVLVLGLEAANAAVLELTGSVRDFCSSTIVGTCSDHPDFEAVIASETGIVESTIGADGKPVYAKGDGSTSATTSGATAFDQWYRDTPGVNSSTPLTIELDNSITADPSVFTFASSSFFPIDGKLFGNEGRPHNYHFTFEMHTEFFFNGSESFTFTGDDDLWVFINGILAIDLGGVHGSATATVDLADASTQAALGISPDSTYALDLFFAERHTTASTFRIDTSLELVAVPIPPAVALLLPAVALLLRRSN